MLHSSALLSRSFSQVSQCIILRMDSFKNHLVFRNQSESISSKQMNQVRALKDQKNFPCSQPKNSRIISNRRRQEISIEIPFYTQFSISIFEGCIFKNYWPLTPILGLLNDLLFSNIININCLYRRESVNPHFCANPNHKYQQFIFTRQKLDRHREVSERRFGVNSMNEIENFFSKATEIHLGEYGLIDRFAKLLRNQPQGTTRVQINVIQIPIIPLKCFGQVF